LCVLLDGAHPPRILLYPDVDERCLYFRAHAPQLRHPRKREAPRVKARAQQVRTLIEQLWLVLSAKTFERYRGLSVFSLLVQELRALLGR
jgi:hypothetical protein